MNVTEFFSTTMAPVDSTGLNVGWSDLMSTTMMPETTTAASDVRSWLTNIVLQVGSQTAKI